MAQFRYLRDPLFLLCVVGFLVNRLVLKPHFPNWISESYFNDLICIPLWVPLMLSGMRALGWRSHDGLPRPHEVAIPLVVWSFVFEIVLPNVSVVRTPAIADPIDILCYSLGALIASILWSCQPTFHGSQEV